jgi:hypothetical protein
MTRHDASRHNWICQDYKEEHEMSLSGQLRLEAKLIFMDWYPRTFKWLINVAFVAVYSPISIWEGKSPFTVQSHPQLEFHYLSTEPSPWLISLVGPCILPERLDAVSLVQS